MKNFIIYIFKWLTIVGLFGGFIYFMKTQEGNREEQYKSELSPYNDQTERYLKSKSSAEDRIPAQGQVIFIKEKTRRLEKFSDYTLSARNQPKDPKNVDSVVLHNCDYVQVGSYTNGAKAMQHVCELTVIDVASGAWSKWGVHKGKMPPEEIKRKRGGSSDENGAHAIYSFIAAGGII